KHYVEDISLYRESFLRSFSIFNGKIEGMCVLGLLPSYLERNNSSLVLMVDELIKLSGHPQSGFYLDDTEKLRQTLVELNESSTKTILFGVSFALMDFAEKFSLQLKNTNIIETGGMKGRRKELTQKELHEFLCKKFGVDHIHSEYGMTELLSQAYSSANG